MRDEIERLNYKCKPLEMEKYKAFVEEYALTPAPEQEKEEEYGQELGEL